MLTTYKCKNFFWVDLENPTADEIKPLIKKYNLNPMVADELLKPTVRPRCEQHKNYIYMILHFPVFDQTRKGSLSCEVDFVIGKNFLITSHYNQIPLLHEITKVFNVNSITKENNETMTKSPSVLVCLILKQFYALALRQLDHVKEKTDKLENEIFKGKEYSMLEAISYIRRDLIDFFNTIYLHDNVLDTFRYNGEKFFGRDFHDEIAAVQRDLQLARNLSKNYNETIRSIHDTNDSLLTDKVNNTMRILNVLAFLTFPLMLFVNIFSMSTVYTPIVGLRGDFWIITGIMAASVTLIALIFKRKRWL